MSSPGPKHKYVLVTGANSGLGFATCSRLIDEHLSDRLSHEHLTLVITTRSVRKSEETIQRLRRRLQTHTDTSPQADSINSRLSFHAENLELTSLLSVYECAQRLCDAIPKLDVAILNAGIGGWIGNNWPLAWWRTATDLVQAVTWPPFKLAPAGLVTDPQLPESITVSRGSGEPILGKLFCANVFGHYVLVHQLLPLLRSIKLQSPGRIVWISSIEACQSHFDINDLQGVRTLSPYESSKRLTDILVLTSNLPSCRDTVASYLSLPSTPQRTSVSEGEGMPSAREQAKVDLTSPPTIHVAQPGICATSVFPLPLILKLCMLASVYIARFLGSPWHNVSAYLGATAPIWLACVDQETLQKEDRRRALWGSTINRLGTKTEARRTDVEGWGQRGQANEKWWGGTGSAGGRKRGTTDATAEDIERFEELGRQCWEEMEKLRTSWDEIIKDYIA
ncbi:MAG: hypothetical protein Q9160_003360 [Pyrenula sp. 1 TL-2023]